MSEGIGIERQQAAIAAVRQEHFKKLLGNGIVRKVVNSARRRAELCDGCITSYEESMPVVLGSDSPESGLHLFIGLQVVSNSFRRTQLIPAGVVNGEDTRPILPFDDLDLRTIHKMYIELVETQTEAAPDYNLEMGVFKR